MKRLLSLTLVLLLFIPMLSGCGPKAPASLIVGLDDTFAPMGFRDPQNNLVGFDIDLSNAVAKELGYTITFQPIDWDAKEMELNSKRIDCIWNGMSHTPARAETMTLSQPYLNNRIIIMTTSDATVSSMDDLKKYQIGTQAESAALEVIQEHPIYEDIKDSLLEYRTYDECILDMQSGRIQVMVVDEVLGMYKNTNLPAKLSVSPVDFGDDYYVIGFRKEDTELCSKIEGALKKLIDNGEAAKISEKWFGVNNVLPLK